MKHGSIDSYEHLIGKLVSKRRSGKLFKSGNKEEVVVSLCMHNMIDEVAAVFTDGSICAAHKLEVVVC